MSGSTRFYKKYSATAAFCQPTESPRQHTAGAFTIRQQLLTTQPACIIINIEGRRRPNTERWFPALVTRSNRCLGEEQGGYFFLFLIGLHEEANNGNDQNAGLYQIGICNHTPRPPFVSIGRQRSAPRPRGTHRLPSVDSTRL